MATSITSITSNQYICANCEFKCSKKGDWNRHIITKKHCTLTDINTNTSNKKINGEHVCGMCSKAYKSRVGLWKHSKTCVVLQVPMLVPPMLVPMMPPMPVITQTESSVFTHTDASNNEIKILTNLVLELVKSNSDLQKQMLDVCKNIQPANSTTISNNNNNNKTFNLQFFLNEECKDAMNLKDFVESFQLQLTDLEKIGDVGYIEGVSNLILDKLNDTDIHKRPVHCSDAKRETLYVKDDNVWTKEGAENVKIRGAVKNIEKKNIKLLNVWKEAHTGCMDSESPYNDQYTHMIIGSLGGCEPDNVNKVIKKIAKATIIDK